MVNELLIEISTWYLQHLPLNTKSCKLISRWAYLRYGDSKDGIV
jgi:hypothetical protein